MANNRGGLSKREFAAQSAGQPMPYAAPKPQDVYSANNIASSVTSTKPDYAGMAVDKLGKQLAKAKNKAELNQIKIMNQPISMGVITGQAAHMAAINNAQINSLAGIYDAKNAELTRKSAAEQQAFTNDLALKNYDLNAENTKSTIAARNASAGAGTVAQQQGKQLVTAENTLYQSRGQDGFTDPQVYQQQRQDFVSKGGKYTDFDNQFSGMLSDQEKSNLKIKSSTLTPAQETTVRTIANGFDNEQIAKDFNQVAQAVNYSQGIDNNTKNPADNQMLISSFAKAMDPNSVVREGEYATVQRYSQTWLENFGFNAARVVNNQEFLTPEAIQNMKDAILNKYKSVEPQYKNLAAEYGRRINVATGLDNGQDYITNYAGGLQNQEIATSGNVGVSPDVNTWLQSNGYNVVGQPQTTQQKRGGVLNWLSNLFTTK